MKNRYILDSYAFLCWFQDEKGAEAVDRLIKKAKEDELKLFISLINLGEIYYTIYRRTDPLSAKHALSVIDALPVEQVAVGREIMLQAAELKAAHPIAYADAFAAALGIVKDGIVITGDLEFKHLEKLVEIQWL